MKIYLLPALALSVLLSVTVEAKETAMKTSIVAEQSNANGFDSTEWAARQQPAMLKSQYELRI